MGFMWNKQADMCFFVAQGRLNAAVPLCILYR